MVDVRIPGHFPPSALVLLRGREALLARAGQVWSLCLLLHRLVEPVGCCITRWLWMELPRTVPASPSASLHSPSSSFYQHPEKDVCSQRAAHGRPAGLVAIQHFYQWLGRGTATNMWLMQSWVELLIPWKRETTFNMILTGWSPGLNTTE